MEESKRRLAMPWMLPWWRKTVEEKTQRLEQHLPVWDPDSGRRARGCSLNRARVLTAMSEPMVAICLFELVKQRKLVIRYVSYAGQPAARFWRRGEPLAFEPPPEKDVRRVAEMIPTLASRTVGELRRQRPGVTTATVYRVARALRRLGWLELDGVPVLEWYHGKVLRLGSDGRLQAHKKEVSE